MPEMTFGQTTAGITVPAGRYVAKFIGTEAREPFQDSKFAGQVGQPRMAWVFEVREGEHKGEKFAQETGCRASPKSACARIISGLAGGKIAVGEKVKTEDFIGRVYVVKVGPNPNSDKGNLYVADIEPHQSGAAPAPTTTPAKDGPPPRRPASQQPRVDQVYWIDKGDGSEEKVEGEAVRAFIFQKGVKAAELMLCKVGEAEWKPASAFGFEDAQF